MLRQSGISVSYKQVTQELDIHPDYPSLLHISDVLSWFGLKNEAYQITPDDLSEVPLPFVAHALNKGNEYMLVATLSDNEVAVSSGDKAFRKMPRTEFNQLFTGAVLVHDEDELVKSIKPTYNKSQHFTSSLRYPATLLLLTFMFIAGVVVSTGYLPVLSRQILLLTVFKTVGVVTSILLLVQSVNSNNPLIQILCGGKNTNCNVILSSKAAKVFEGLTWSEVGFFYFTGTWLMLMFGGASAPLMQTMVLLNVASLPYTFYSIYYQAKIAKQWCTLCCTIHALLWLEFVPIITYLHAPFSLPNGAQAINMLICLLLPVAGWIILKPLLLQLQKVKPLQSQLRQFKYNSELFKSQLKQQPKYALPDEKWSIVLGNVEAEHILTMVSNPYCQPCAKAHKTLAEWLSHRNDIQLRLVFTANNTDEDIKTPVVRHLMALNDLPDKTIVHKALDDWYAQKQKSYTAWAKAYTVSLDTSQNYKLDKQTAWCNMAEVKFTPTVLIDGHQLPRAYSYTMLNICLISIQNTFRESKGACTLVIHVALL